MCHAVEEISKSDEMHAREREQSHRSNSSSKRGGGAVIVYILIHVLFFVSVSFFDSEVDNNIN